MGAALWGFILGPRWLLIAALIALGLLLVFMLVFARRGAVAIPFAIFRHWGELTPAGKLVLGSVAVLLALMMAVLVYAIIALMLVSP